MSNAPLSFGPPTTAQRRQVLEILLSARPSEEIASAVDELLAAERAGETSLDGLTAAWRGGQPVAATWVQRHGQGGAELWPPRRSRTEPAATSDALLRHVIDDAFSRRVTVVQCLVREVDTEAVTSLQSTGFAKIASLLYMVCLGRELSRESPAASSSATSLTFEPYRTTNAARMAAVVERTYVGTLDCPGLGGLRDVRDVIDAYHATGRFDPASWWFVRREDVDHQVSDIGCALMTGHPRNTQAELMYMGLVPEARSQGLGREVVQHVKRAARTAGFRRLVVAVDRNNTPALRVYEGEGFHVWDERDVWIKTNATPTATQNDEQ